VPRGGARYDITPLCRCGAMSPQREISMSEAIDTRLARCRSAPASSAYAFEMLTVHDTPLRAAAAPTFLPAIFAAAPRRRLS
jgi:hypothetical protein